MAAIAVCIWGFGGENLLFVAPAAILVVVAFLSVASADALRTLATRARNQPWACASGAMIVIAFLVLPLSANRYIASVECAWALILAAAFSVAALVRARDVAPLVAGLVAVVIAYAVYGFVQAAGMADRSFWHNAHYASRFVNSAHFATTLAAAVCLSVGLAVHRGARAVRIVGLVGIPVSLVGLMMTGTRAAWLAAAVVALAAGVGVIMRRPAGGARRRIAGVAVVLLLLAGIAAGLAAAQGAVGERLRDLATLRAAGVGQRLLLWNETLDLIAANPLGVGLGGFGERYLQYASASNRYIAYRAHNEILQTIAELGWIAVPLLTWFCVAAARSAVAGCKGTATPLGIGILAALAVSLLHSMVDFPLRIRGNSLLFVTLAGAWVALQADSDAPSGTGGRLVSRALRATACLLALAWVAIGTSNRHAKQGLRELDVMELDRALEELDRAAKWMPHDPDVAFARGRALYAKATFAPSDEKRILLESACEAFRRSAGAAPHRAHTHIRLAWARAGLGDARGAEKAFRHAISLDAAFGIWRYYYAEFLLEQQRYEDAAAAYCAGLELLEDSGVYTPRRIFEQLYAASGDPAIVRAACPDTPREQNALAKFLRTIQ